ncbi:MAG TPA: hypothetical protein VGL38_08050 [bacterium]|jgi:Na+/proline symporter
MAMSFEALFAIILLAVLLFGSLIVGFLSRRGMVSAKDYLFARDMTWYHFALNTIGTNISVSGGLVLTIAYAYRYGWSIGIGILGSFIIGLIVYRRFISKVLKVRAFFSETENYSIISFISNNYEADKDTRKLTTVVSVAIIVSYWATFSAELLAVAKILGPFWADDAYWLILLGGLICVFYTIIGGYKSVFLTDGIQTGILGISVVWFSYSVFAAHPVPVSTLFAARTIPISESIGVIVLLVVIGVAFQITAMDMWVRTQAANASRNLSEPKSGLIWSVLGSIFFLGILSVGLLAYNILPVQAEGFEGVLPSLIKFTNGSGPATQGIIGSFLVLIFAVALSTADTCLITAAQVVYQDFLPSMKPGIEVSMMQSRLIVAVMGVLGVALAFVLPGVIEGAFLFAGAQLILVPLLIGSVKDDYKSPRVALTAVVVGLTIMFPMIVMDHGRWAAISPIIAVLVTGGIYFIFGKRTRKGKSVKVLSNA